MILMYNTWYSVRNFKYHPTQITKSTKQENLDSGTDIAEVEELLNVCKVVHQENELSTPRTKQISKLSLFI